MGDCTFSASPGLVKKLLFLFPKTFLSLSFKPSHSGIWGLFHNDGSFARLAFFAFFYSRSRCRTAGPSHQHNQYQEVSHLRDRKQVRKKTEGKKEKKIKTKNPDP